MAPFSIYVTRFALWMGLTANAVTLTSVLSSLAGSVLLLSLIPGQRLLGAALIVFGYLLDLVDGEVARYHAGKQKLNAAGMFADYVGHVMHQPLLFACWGFATHRLTGAQWVLWVTPLLILGAIPSALLAKQVILIDLVRRGLVDPASEEFRFAAIDKPGEQGLSEALGGDIVEAPGLRNTLSQTFGYPGPLLIIPGLTAMQIATAPSRWSWLATLLAIGAFASVYALNVPRTLHRNLRALDQLGSRAKRAPHP
jgi:hypothetical protein